MTEIKISPIDIQISKLFALGHSTDKVAKKMKLSARTIENRTLILRRRLKLKNKVQLVVWMVKNEKI